MLDLSPGPLQRYGLFGITLIAMLYPDESCDPIAIGNCGYDSMGHFRAESSSLLPFLFLFLIFLILSSSLRFLFSPSIIFSNVILFVYHSIIFSFCLSLCYPLFFFLSFSHSVFRYIIISFLFFDFLALSLSLLVFLFTITLSSLFKFTSIIFFYVTSCLYHFIILSFFLPFPM